MSNRDTRNEYLIFDMPKHSFQQYVNAEALAGNLNLALDAKSVPNYKGKVWPNHK